MILGGLRVNEAACKYEVMNRRQYGSDKSVETRNFASLHLYNPHQ